SNAGLWCIGRLQTDADRARVVEGLADAGVRGASAELNTLLKRLAPRWFLVRNAHAPQAGPLLLHPRHTMSLLRGPLTPSELMAARNLKPTPSQLGREGSRGVNPYGSR